MKRYRNLYSKIYDRENILDAHQNARRGKRFYREVVMVDENPEKYVNEIHEMLKNKTFRNAPYERFQRVEGNKLRDIAKLPYYPDRIIHHCIMNILEPIWMNLFIRDTYSSMKGRGIHDGVRRMKRFLKDKPGTRYCLKLDVRKFYPSINHDILKAIIRKKIKCSDTLWLLDEIIDSSPGVPIGNYLSQFFANLYLAYFDHWAKEEKGLRYYSRYCDDIVIMYHDKESLHSLLREIQVYFKDNLHLDVKGNWQVFPTKVRGVDFLGYRFYGSHTLIRKRIASAYSQRSNKIVQKNRANGSDVCAVMSYFGWFLYGNGRNLWRKYATKTETQIADACQRLKIKNPYLKGAANVQLQHEPTGS